MKLHTDKSRFGLNIKYFVKSSNIISELVTYIFSILLCTILLGLQCIWIKANYSTPCFKIATPHVLADAKVDIKLIHLKPNQRITVTASAQQFKSKTEYTADANGQVNLYQPKTNYPVAEKAPLEIIWSMKADPNWVNKNITFNNSLDTFKISLSAEKDGNEVARGEFELLYITSQVDRIPIHEGKLRGVFFRPKAKHRYPGIIVLSGSGGGIWEIQASLLATHGYSVLALAYFNYEDLPKNLVNIPLEYFAEAIKWLQKQKCVQADNLAVIGTSRGGELSLLLASMFLQIKAVVARVPSHVVWGGFSADPKEVQTNAWTFEGKPLPNIETTQIDSIEEARLLKENPEIFSPIFKLYLKDEEAVRKSIIPAERIKGPVFLTSGEDDKLWPSAMMADLVIKRLSDHMHPYSYEHLSYKSAGHYVGKAVPNMPLGVTRQQHGLTKSWMEMGGTPEGNAFAAFDSWNRMLNFLDKTLNIKNK